MRLAKTDLHAWLAIFFGVSTIAVPVCAESPIQSAPAIETTLRISISRFQNNPPEPLAIDLSRGMCRMKLPPSRFTRIRRCEQSAIAAGWRRRHWSRREFCRIRWFRIPAATNRREHGCDDHRIQFQRRLGIELADSIFAKANRSAKKFPLCAFRRCVAGMAGGPQCGHSGLSRRRIERADRAGAGGESRFAGKHRCHAQGGGGARKNSA